MALPSSLTTAAGRGGDHGDGSYSSSAIKDPVNAWRVLVLIATTRVKDAFSVLMKSALALSAVAFLSLILYFTFSSSSSSSSLLLLSCPSCDRVSTPLVSLRRIAGLADEPETEPPTNISHILFGIGGSAKTWDKRRHYCELWWRPNDTHGFVWLDERPRENARWPEGSPPYRVSEGTSQFNYTCWYGSRSAIRIARIIKESFDLGLSNIRWDIRTSSAGCSLLVNLILSLNSLHFFCISDHPSSLPDDEQMVCNGGR